MSDSYFSPEERRYIEGSEVFTRFSTVPFSSLTVADLVTALNKITPSPENAPIIKWLTFLIRNLAMDSSGRRNVVEQNSNAISTNMADTESILNLAVVQLLQNSSPYVGGKPDSSSFGAGGQLAKKMAASQYTLAAGAIANAQVVAASASAYPRMLLKGVLSDTNIVAGLQLHFESSTPTDCNGLPGGNLVCGALTQYVPLALNPPILVYHGDAGQVIRVDITNGAGTEKIVLQYDWWHEY